MAGHSAMQAERLSARPDSGNRADVAQPPDVFNGDFEWGTKQEVFFNDDRGRFPFSYEIPGWSFHGGEGFASILGQDLAAVFVVDLNIQGKIKEPIEKGIDFLCEKAVGIANLALGDNPKQWSSDVYAEMDNRLSYDLGESLIANGISGVCSLIKSDLNALWDTGGPDHALLMGGPNILTTLLSQFKPFKDIKDQLSPAMDALLKGLNPSNYNDFSTITHNWSYIPSNAPAVVFDLTAPFLVVPDTTVEVYMDAKLEPGDEQALASYPKDPNGKLGWKLGAVTLEPGFFNTRTYGVALPAVLNGKVGKITLRIAGLEGQYEGFQLSQLAFLDNVKFGPLPQANHAPIVTLAIPPAKEGDQLTIQYKIEDPDTSQSWDFEMNLGNGNATGSVNTPGLYSFTHVYEDNAPTPDGWPVSMKVTDGVSTSIVSAKAFIQNVAPKFDPPPTTQINVDEGTKVDFTDAWTFTDPGFGPTEYWSYQVDWSDGAAKKANVTDIIDGQQGTPSIGRFGATHTYGSSNDFGQPYNIQVTVSDDDKGTDTLNIVANVKNVEPTVDLNTDRFAYEGEKISVTFSFSDPGFDDTWWYEVDWGDKEPIDGAAVTQVVEGGPGVPAKGSFTVSHTYADDGKYQVNVVVRDDDGGKGTETFQVDVDNVDPYFTQVSVPTSIDEGSIIPASVSFTFQDPGYGPTETFSYDIDWGNSTIMSGFPAIIAGAPGKPTQGSFGGTYTYGTNNPAGGPWPFRAVISDDDGGSAVINQPITVNNVPPKLTSPDRIVGTVGESIPVTDLGVFTDPGWLDQWTYSIYWDDGTSNTNLPATVDVQGSAGVPAEGSFDGQHTYSTAGLCST